MKVATTEFHKFRNAVVSLKEVPEDELRLQYRIFIERLVLMTAKHSVEQLQESDTKELIKQFLDPPGDQFKGTFRNDHAGIWM